MATRIVDQMIRRLRAPEANQSIEWDSEIPGFGVRITAAGVISFILDYRNLVFDGQILVDILTERRTGQNISFDFPEAVFELPPTWGSRKPQ